MLPCLMSSSVLSIRGTVMLETESSDNSLSRSMAANSKEHIVNQADSAG